MGILCDWHDHSGDGRSIRSTTRVELERAAKDRAVTKDSGSGSASRRLTAATTELGLDGDDVA